MVSKPFASVCFFALALASLGAPRSYAATEPVRTSTFTFVPKVAVAKPRPLVLRGAPAAGAPYTIVDDGTLPAGADTLETPVAFNDADQIAGTAYDTALNVPVCVLFDGKNFRDASTLSSIASCSVNGISARTSTGSVALVGSVTTEYSGTDTKALYSSTLPNSPLFRTAVFTNDASSLTAINAGGKALGSAAYDPLGGFITAQPPFVVSPGGGALHVLQTTCATPKPGCGELVSNAFHDYYYGYSGCGFGGCSLAADGTALLYDLFGGSLELVAPSGTAHDVAIDADVVTPPFMNDAKQIVYGAETVEAGVSVIRTQLYSPVTGAITTLPPLPGESCQEYIPVSINNAGRVLGFALCADGYEYFTYDAASGIVALPASFAGGYYSVSPFAINDNGQILVNIVRTSGGLNDWGYLQPAAGGELHRRSVSAVARRPAAGARMRIPVRAARAALAERVPASRLPAGGNRPIALPRYSRSAAVPGFTLVDDGAPPASAYLLQAPVAFNNDGQIVGSVTDVPYRNNTACLLFDGTHFRDLAPGNGFCAPYSVSDVNPHTGSLDIVGTSTSAYDVPYLYLNIGKAFESVFDVKSGALVTRRFPANDDSALVGVNGSGEAIGFGMYSPAGAPAALPQFELAPGASALSLLPQCLSKTGCGVFGLPNCAFGGCFITSDGTLLIRNVLISPGGSETVLDYASGDFQPIIDNNGLILYESAGYNSSDTELYDLKTKTTTTVPHVPGSTCASYVPISFNNAGHVLGAMGPYCAGSDSSYFIYDPVNGTRDLATLLPAGSATITPLGINDADQILVEITFPNGTNHWGILRPTSNAAGRRALRRRDMHG
jgi:hypothetical protein